MTDALRMFTIYGPANVEYPGVFVVRRWMAVTGAPPERDELPTIVAPSLEHARAGIERLAPGLVVLTRDLDDDPCIIETWL